VLEFRLFLEPKAPFYISLQKAKWRGIGAWRLVLRVSYGQVLHGQAPDHPAPPAGAPGGLPRPHDLQVLYLYYKIVINLCLYPSVICLCRGCLDFILCSLRRTQSKILCVLKVSGNLFQLDFITLLSPLT
jgi:hypothetical protein